MSSVLSDSFTRDGLYPMFSCLVMVAVLGLTLPFILNAQSKALPFIIIVICVLEIASHFLHLTLQTIGLTLLDIVFILTKSTLELSPSEKQDNGDPLSVKQLGFVMAVALQ